MITHEEMRKYVAVKLIKEKVNLDEVIKYISQQETLEVTHGVLMLKYDLLTVKYTKLTELLGLYQDLFKKLELTVEHDTTDTWAGFVEYNYVEINGGITDEVETVEKIIKLQKELGGIQ